MKLNLRTLLSRHILISVICLSTGIVFTTDLFAQSKTGDEYSVTLKSADDFYNAKDYRKALSEYKKAILFKPGEKQVQDRIDLINRVIEESEKNKNLSFEEAILTAEKSFKAKDYPSAKQLFEKALELDPSAQYPKDRLAQIRTLYTDPNDILRFNEAMATGNREATAGNYDKARNWFEIALAAKPDSRPARDKIAEIDRLKVEAKAKKQQYEKWVADADKLLQSDKRTEARAIYKQAADLFPGEPTARVKIQEIDNWLNAKKSRQESFDKAIDLADQFYINRDFTNARIKYQEALIIRPEARYPKEMLDKTSKGEAQVQTIKERFDADVASADKFYLLGDLESALLSYKSALSIIPESPYPKLKVDEIEKAIGERNSRKEAYDIAIKNGDQALAENKYDISLGHFRNAITLFPDQKYPKDKIDEITTIIGILAKQKADQKQLDDDYSKIIASADKALAVKNYSEAISAYQQALALKAGEKYPQDKITEINSILAELKNKDEAFAAAISRGELAANDKQYAEALGAFQEALGIKPSEKYPTDKITEINGILNGIKETDENYNKAIAGGDAAFDNKNYSEAFDSYRLAGQVKPSEKYPQDKITEIKGILAELKATDDTFSAALSDGDRLFTELKYKEAITSYQKALKIKPGLKYPADKIVEANTILSDLKARQDTFDKSVAEGDKLLAARNYTGALDAFGKALSAKPDEAYPRQKISEINTTTAALKARDESYDKAVADGDGFYNVKKYREALEPYERAATIKPDEGYPKQQKEKINLALAEQKKLDDQYIKTIADAETLLNEKKYQSALNTFESASDLKKEETYPMEKIAAIKAILAGIRARDEEYNKSLAEGDAHLASKDLNGALDAFNNALKIKPGEAYPTEKVSSIKAELKAIDENYNRILAEGDAKLAARNYSVALNAYQQAIDIKPAEQYPKDKIAQINETLVREKEEQDRLYTESITEGDQLLAAQNYVDAKRGYVKASGIKPLEQYPKDKLIEINLVLDARAKAAKDEYDKAVVDADRLYQQKVLDQAIDGYEKAASIKPDETYPGEMIRRIKQYIADHSILDVNTATVIIPAGDEHKFAFTGIEPRLRNNNYVMIRAKALGETPPKVYFNYGRDNAKNGGIVLRTISNKEGVDYLIRLAGQDKWYREDNNWLSIYTEGSGVEISRIQISQGE